MSTGADLRRAEPVTPLPAERTVEMVAVPPGLYTLRAIVLGAAAVIGAIGVLTFLQVPSTLPGPAQAAAELGQTGLEARAGCGAACLGRAGAIREVDVLPEGLLPTVALGAVTRAEPEPPMAATPPPATAPQADSDDDQADDRDERSDQTDDKAAKSADKAHGKTKGEGKEKGKSKGDDD